MHKLIALAAIAAAAPAAAQDGWPVTRNGAVCTTARGASPTSDALVVRYDTAAGRLSLQTAVESDEAAGAGTLDLGVFFDKGPGEELDIGWGYRTFAYRRGNGRIDLTTAFTGARNIDQLLTDLATSKRLGVVRDRTTVADFDLAGIGSAVAGLKACARGA